MNIKNGTTYVVKLRFCFVELLAQSLGLILLPHSSDFYKDGQVASKDG